MRGGSPKSKVTGIRVSTRGISVSDSFHALSTPEATAEDPNDALEPPFAGTPHPATNGGTFWKGYSSCLAARRRSEIFDTIHSLLQITRLGFFRTLFRTMGCEVNLPEEKLLENLNNGEECDGGV